MEILCELALMTSGRWRSDCTLDMIDIAGKARLKREVDVNSQTGIAASFA